ncbi:hypothetical protein AGMMS49942_14950 [Spirochaetia bacterium]|nr:hypothetical protein AGMMS49942_14950 [Spirochaetia bacterium]
MQDSEFAYPKDDLGFDSLGKRLLSYMVTDGSRLLIDAGAIAAAAVPINAYSAALNTVHNVPNHSLADISAKDEAKAASISAVNAFITLNLRTNALWTRVDSVKVGFGDGGGSTSLRPPPSTHPNGSYAYIEPGRLKAKFRDEVTGRVAIPDGADRVDVLMVFDNGDGTCTTWTENYSTAHPVIILPPECCNKKGMAKARWQNNNPTKGPWSDSVPVLCLLMDTLGNSPVFLR